jgi:glyoxylase-like metal-dependent hydrolase (beta-lactamase superfamily II)
VTKLAILLIFLLSILFVSAQELPKPAASQAPSPGQTTSRGSLRQIIPGHYVYSTTNAGRVFSSGVIVTNEGVMVVDALDSEAIARAERESISSTIKQPVRYLVSSSFHDPFSKGNIAYGDVFKIGHENYRAGLLDQMKRGSASAEEQRARLPTETFRDRVTLYLDAKEVQILYFGAGHTRGDSVVFVPQDRIAYLSEVFFFEEFPNMAQGYGVSWLRVLDGVEALEADIFVPGHGPIPEDARGTRAGLHRMRQILIDARDAIQNEVSRGATEDQVAAAVKLPQYEKLPTYAAQREVMVRRMYKELTGNLQ